MDPITCRRPHAAAAQLLSADTPECMAPKTGKPWEKKGGDAPSPRPFPAHISNPAEGSSLVGKLSSQCRTPQQTALESTSKTRCPPTETETLETLCPLLLRNLGWDAMTLDARARARAEICAKGRACRFHYVTSAREHMCHEVSRHRGTLQSTCTRAPNKTRKPQRHALHDSKMVAGWHTIATGSPTEGRRHTAVAATARCRARGSTHEGLVRAISGSFPCIHMQGGSDGEAGGPCTVPHAQAARTNASGVA